MYVKDTKLDWRDYWNGVERENKVLTFALESSEDIFRPQYFG